MRETVSAILMQKGKVWQMENIRSEHTKNMTAEEMEKLQQEVAEMTPEQLKAFRNSKDADSMGYWGEE